MPIDSAARDLVLGITPGHEPNADLVVAVERAGFVGLLDLGPGGESGADAGGDRAAAAAIGRVRQRLAGRPFGVRVRGGHAADGLSLPPEVDTILLDPLLCPRPWPDPWPDGWPERGSVRVLAEVTSAQEAADALRRGADGLVARGFEAGGRIGELSTFVLLQRLVADFPGVPVWAMGGIGPHTAAAALAGGARGVALDAQLALAAEAALPAEVAAAIAAMDGSETRVSGGFRFYTRRDLPPIDPASGRFGPGDLRAQLLPVGQDGAFAAPLARRYRTAGGITRAVAATATAQVELAARIAPLREAVPVQGPMTGVSDRAEFAAAVADGGGLPFLALALMPGDQAAELLARTGALLRGRPWGAGILGFAPPEVREAQLEAIVRARPPYALIAGGRPSQAAALTEAGIETFLHVPSAGLLGQFLAAGARRFVFEGAECGGHTGPRGSFALWEAQVARLLEQPDLDGVHAWFAGGVHDARSAAMVAAMAAPLAERGARVSVLMGTAYLFTREIVSSGAVVPLYQRTARECTGTALLESSPGHVIRCADTPYVATFGTAKERLAATGATQQEAWAELEQLSLGRLRVAAKGLRRDGEALVPVDEQAASGEGMFMLGQVATLRSAATTVAALHRQVTAGAGEFLAARAGELAVPAAAGGGPRPLDVAIVGMACVYPGADGLGRYWANVLAGTDEVGEVPAERWSSARYPGVPARGGFLPRVPFNALAYGIPPSALASIEPVQLLALEVAARALADAGYATRPFDRSRASVIFGAGAGSDLSSAYGLRSALPGYRERPDGALPGGLDEFLPRLTEDSFPGVLGNVIAGRIANRLDLGGVNYAVDAACASSLAALDLACKELAAGTSDVVLCGGADTHNGIHDYEMFASVHALSPSGRCATFDARADGIALGEGVGCLVLKRLADAERDGDRVYAVVRGIGGSSDGRSPGLTAPSPEGQRLALERAYAMAGVSPAQVGLVEAHGTGTVAGDRAELAALTTVFTEAGAEPGGCAIGSVKSQVGDARCAAGLAGLIKVACALHAGALPPAIHLSEPNAYWDAATSPFAFVGGTARPWSAAPGRRHAGVSAFGFGGTNFHAVLSGYDGADPPAHGLRDWPAELFTLRGDAAESARLLIELAEENDKAGRPWRLAELAATMAARPGPVRSAFVAGSLDDLTRRLHEPGGIRAAGPPAEPGAVAFLFPGQGSQRAGMTADLFTAFPRLHRLLRLAGRDAAAAMFPAAAFSGTDRARQAAALTGTRVAQPALGLADLAVWELLTMTGVRPDMAAGHGYGELAALCAASAYDEAALLALSAARADAILAAIGDDPGAMASVSADAALVAARLDGTGVVIASHNAPDQVVISGPTAAVESAAAALTESGLPARRLSVASAFHSPLVAPAVTTMAAALAGQPVAGPRFPVFANATAAPYPGTPDEVRRQLAAQVADPVRFADQVEAMYAAGARTFVEAGPGRVLSGLVGRVLGARPHTAVACDVPGENGLRRFLAALAELAGAGVPVEPGPLFAGRAEPVTGRPAQPGWTVDGQLVRTADGEPVAGGLRPATEAPGLPLDGAADPATTAPADRDGVVTEYLRTTRELIAVQREVLLRYLGTAPPPAAGPAPVTTAPATATANGDIERTVAPPAHPAPAAPAAVAEPAGARPAGLPDRAEIGAAVPWPRAAVAEAEGGDQPDGLPGVNLPTVPSPDTPPAGAVPQQATAARPAEAAEAVPGDVTAVRPAQAAAPVPGQPPVSAPGVPRPGAPAPRVTTGGGAVVARPRRFLVETVPLPPTRPAAAPSGRFLVVEDGRGVALELADLLEQQGAEAVVTETPTARALLGASALVHLGALRPGGRPVLPTGFGLVRDALAVGVRTVLVATVGGGGFGEPAGWDDEPADLGLRGLIRTVAAEYPGTLARAVDVEPKDSPRNIAAQLMAELSDPAGPAVVGYLAGRRTGLRVAEAPSALAAGRGPAGLGLDADSVVLLTGGARGITASVALALARTAGCHIELIGRTPPPGLADPELDHADAAALRRLLIARATAQGRVSARRVEAEMVRLLREREVRATLDGLRAVAASVRYHDVDVRDAAAVRSVLADVYARFGRVDGVIHGAGVTEDRLIADKTPDSFTRVYRTKVDGARALAAGLRGDHQFFVLFGSVSGVYGNRGQADYAAANDALDSLARHWSRRGVVPSVSSKVVSVDWGPWAGGGMVSPELAREYARRGVTLIDPAEGVACLLAELADRSGPAQVVYQCGDVPRPAEPAAEPAAEASDQADGDETGGTQQ